MRIIDINIINVRMLGRHVCNGIANNLLITFQGNAYRLIIDLRLSFDAIFNHVMAVNICINYKYNFLCREVF